MIEDTYERAVPSTERLSHAVVVAVADRNGVDPLDLQERLYDCIDPDALDRLFTDENAAGTVQFMMAGCHVEVTADRTVRAYRSHDDAATAEAQV